MTTITIPRSMARLYATFAPRKLVPGDAGRVANWLPFIDYAAANGLLSAQQQTLVQAHEIGTAGHAVKHFAPDIEARCADRLREFGARPLRHVGDVIDDLVRWKTVAQCAYSHDVSKGYFHDAEPHMQLQWTTIIWPLVQDLDFTVVLDLACGHGRNSEFLRRLTRELHLVDINQSCLDACRERFGESIDGTAVHYHRTDGNSIPVDDASISLVYSWDSMVHFDKLVVRDYVREVARVLRPGGSAFLHHSNFGAVAPNSDWAKNTGTRSDMSAELMREYARESGLAVTRQQIQGRAEGWGEDGLDCVSILRKPG